MADIFSKLRTRKKVIREMSEKSRLRSPFHNQHRKGAETLLQSRRRHLYHIY